MLIRKEVLRDKICDVLKGWILDGTLQPGERIVELTLSRKLDVSRAPLREALWLLARQGLVHIRAHHGATVTQLSEQDIREIFEIRETLETRAALAQDPDDPRLMKRLTLRYQQKLALLNGAIQLVEEV